MTSRSLDIVRNESLLIQKGHINLKKNYIGKLNEGKPHVEFDAAGDGNRLKYKIQI